MNKTEFIKIVQEASQDVLERMTFLEIEAFEPYVENEAILKMDLGASLTFKGEYTGTIFINCSKNFSIESTANLLGKENEEVLDVESEDTIKELVNMFIGNILHNINEEICLATLEIPKVFTKVDGISFKLEDDILVFPFQFTSFSSESEDNIEDFYVKISLSNSSLN